MKKEDTSAQAGIVILSAVPPDMILEATVAQAVWNTMIKINCGDSLPNYPYSVSPKPIAKNLEFPMNGWVPPNANAYPNWNIFENVKHYCPKEENTEGCVEDNLDDDRLGTLVSNATSFEDGETELHEQDHESRCSNPILV
jgi:hypothetical protein